MTAAELIAQTVDAVDLGTPTAAKRGRDPRWPYVPVIFHAGTPTSPASRTEQLPRLAYAEREEAIAAAAHCIAARRAHLARRLAAPASRALREWHGLPRELAELADPEGNQ